MACQSAVCLAEPLSWSNGIPNGTFPLGRSLRSLSADCRPLFKGATCLAIK